MARLSPRPVGPAVAPASDEFEVGVAETYAGGDGQVDLGEGFLVQDYLDVFGDVEADDLGDDPAGISEECLAELRVGGDALAYDRLDL